MKKFLLFIGLVVIAYFVGQKIGATVYKSQMASQSETIAQEADAIRNTLERQSAAWNRGDIEGFMAEYWESDDLRFASGGDINKGWDVTRDRYKARYPTQDEMGTLKFTNLDVDVLTPIHALVFGTWTLERAADAPTGLFTLHFRKIDDKWKIVSDHTSSASN